MKRSIQSCLKIYKELLTEYLVLADKTKRKYGWQPGQEFDAIVLSSRDYNLISQKSMALRAIEEVLGLTLKEVQKIEQTIIRQLVNDTMAKKGVSWRKTGASSYDGII